MTAVPNEIFEVLSIQLHDNTVSNPDVCYELFQNSVDKINSYEEAIKRGSTVIPGREELGIACFWLLMLSNASDNDQYWKVVIHLLNTGQGISLYQKCDEILNLKQSAVERVESEMRKDDLS